MALLTTVQKHEAWRELKVAFPMVLTCLLLIAPCFGAERNSPDLKSFYTGHLWFQLRDAIAGSRAPVFYQGVMECAFNRLPRCQKILRVLLNSHPPVEEAVEAHRILASAYFREGKYKTALEQADALLALQPDDADMKGDRPLLTILSSFSDQVVTSKAHSVLNLDEHGLPIVINGAHATYWFDTGANLSVMSESEAKRLGLSIQAVETKAGVMTGAEVRFRVAVAESVQVGGFHLKNVAFLVFPDDQQPFTNLPENSRGLIGMPVLLALGKLSFGQDRRFEISPKKASVRIAGANLCFDGKNPVAQIKYENRELGFTLDTGASNTDLYPPFAAAFPGLLRTGEKKSYKMQGVGSTEELDSVVLPSVEFTIDGFAVALRPATLLLKQSGESSKFFYGNLGVDLLMQPSKTTLDFTNMKLVAR